MRVVIQRSLRSQVEVSDKIIGQIQKGMVLLVCCEKGDTEDTIKKSAEKISKLRIFSDPQTGKMNQDIIAAGGDFLAISQFTLSWNGEKGNRPSFDNSMEPNRAEELFNLFCELLRKTSRVDTGAFGEMMKVSIENDGPVTFTLNF